MAELSDDVKVMLHNDDNPNIISVEFTLSQLEYLEEWSRRLNGIPTDSLIRMMVDTMKKINPLHD